MTIGKRCENKRPKIAWLEDNVSISPQLGHSAPGFTHSPKHVIPHRLEFMVKGGVRQLQTVRNSCARAIDNCEQVVSTLERRENDLREKVMEAYHDVTSKLVALEK
jgi:hypothetical protein